MIVLRIKNFATTKLGRSIFNLSKKSDKLSKSELRKEQEMLHELNEAEFRTSINLAKNDPKKISNARILYQKRKKDINETSSY